MRFAINELKCIRNIRATLDRWQSKKVNTIDERRSKIVRDRVFDCHLSPEWRQTAIVNIVSSDIYPCSSIVKSDSNCRLSGVQTYMIYQTFLMMRVALVGIIKQSLLMSLMKTMRR